MSLVRVYFIVLVEVCEQVAICVCGGDGAVLIVYLGGGGEGFVSVHWSSLLCWFCREWGEDCGGVALCLALLGAFENRVLVFFVIL